MTIELAASRSLALWGEEAEAAAGIARALAGTAFIPSSLRVFDARNNLDWDATVAQITAALLTGQELGLSPMASLRSIDVIPPGSGSPALRAAALRGLLQQHNHEIWVTEATEARAVVRGRRAGSDVIMESVWTIDRARKLQLKGFSDSRAAWQRQPAAMLVARATSECARWVASDVLLGLLTPEELEDGEPDLTEPVPGGDAKATPPAEPRRRTTRRRQSQAPVTGKLPATAALPAASPNPGDDAPASDAGSEAPAAPAPMSPAQRAALWPGLKRIGLTERPEILAAVSRWIGRDIGSSSDLTADEAGVALDAISAEEARQAVVAAQDADELPQEAPPDD